MSHWTVQGRIVRMSLTRTLIHSQVESSPGGAVLRTQCGNGEAVFLLGIGAHLIDDRR